MKICVFQQKAHVFIYQWDNFNSGLVVGKPDLFECEQQIHRSAGAFAQSDQRLCYSLIQSMILKLSSCKILMFQLVSVDEQTCSSRFQSKTQRTDFLSTSHIPSAVRFFE